MEIQTSRNSNIREAIIYIFFIFLLPIIIDWPSSYRRRIASLSTERNKKEKEKNNDVLKNVCLLSIYPRTPLSLSLFLSVQSLLGVTPRWSCGLLFANIQLRNLSLSLSTISPLCSSLNPLALLSLFLSCSSCCRRNCSISCPVRRIVLRSCWINSSRLCNIAFLRRRSIEFCKEKEKKNKFDRYFVREFEEEIGRIFFFIFVNIFANCWVYINFKSRLLLIVSSIVGIFYIILNY